VAGGSGITPHCKAEKMSYQGDPFDILHWNLTDEELQRSYDPLQTCSSGELELTIHDGELNSESATNQGQMLAEIWPQQQGELPGIANASPTSECSTTHFCPPEYLVACQNAFVLLNYQTAGFELVNPELSSLVGELGAGDDQVGTGILALHLQLHLATAFATGDGPHTYTERIRTNRGHSILVRVRLVLMKDTPQVICTILNLTRLRSISRGSTGKEDSSTGMLDDAPTAPGRASFKKKKQDHGARRTNTVRADHSTETHDAASLWWLAPAQGSESPPNGSSDGLTTNSLNAQTTGEREGPQSCIQGVKVANAPGNTDTTDTSVLKRAWANAFTSANATP